MVHLYIYYPVDSGNPECTALIPAGGTAVGAAINAGIKNQHHRSCETAEASATSFSELALPVPMYFDELALKLAAV